MIPTINISEGVAKLECDLIIINAETLKPQLLGLLEDNTPVVLDLSEVQEMDSAGFQLLWLLRQEASERKIDFSITAHSEATLKLIKLYRAEHELVSAKN